MKAWRIKYTQARKYFGSGMMVKNSADEVRELYR